MVSVIPKHIAAFIIGTDHALYRKYKDESNPDIKWTGWARVGGTWVGDPVTIKRIDGEADIFLLDTNHVLHHSVFNFLLGHGLKPWKTLGGPLLSPPAVANSKGTLHIFYIGGDRALYHISWDGVHYTQAESLGGAFLHTPAAVSVGAKDVSVFAVGLTDGRLSHHHWTAATGWEPPTQLPGTWAGTPSAVSDQNGRYDVFGVDTLGKINHISLRDGEQSYESMDAHLKTIDAASWGPGRIDLVGLGLDSAIHHKAWGANSWTQGWENLGGKLVHRPTPVTHSPGALCVLSVGTNSVMYIKVRHPQTGVWGAWTDIQGTVISRVA